MATPKGMHPGHTDHRKCAKWNIISHRNGILEMHVCWDQIGVREISKELRLIADGLDKMPPDTKGEGAAFV
jgi:hypothetical protein